MTVNTTESSAPFATNGVTTNFPFYFKFLANEDLVVTYVDPQGVSTQLLFGTQYTVNGAGNDSGGSIVTSTALAGPGQLVVAREMDVLQQTSLRNQGKFLAETHEDVFDRLTMLIQQGFSLFKRALVRPLGRDYFFAENRRITSVENPIGQQDAATKQSVETYVGHILETGQGPINNAANVVFVGANGYVGTVQDAANKTDPLKGAAMLGALGGSVVDRLTPRVHVRRFGVKGDGLSDDSDALESAILYGGPLEFGSTQIKITRKIAVTVLGAMDWQSTGAVILNGSSADIGAMLDITVLPGLDHRITGKLTIDGNLKSFLGLRVWNKSTAGFPLGYANFYSADTEVRNIRRASTAFNDGDGIVVRGGFQSVTFDRPVIKNILLAAGAGVAGSVGVTGITVFGDATGFPIVTTVNDALIDTVKSEDPAYNSDQDGLRVFGPWFTAGGKTNNVLRVNGGQFRDCWGRSIKSQNDVSFIARTNFASYSGPTTGRNAEIDLQVGAGVVRDISCYYSGANSTPSTVTSFQPNEGVESFAGLLAGAKIFTTSTLKSVCETFPRARTQHRTIVRDVDVIGPITRLVDFRVWSNLSALSVKDCTVNNVSESLVRVVSSGLAGAPYIGNVSIEDCVNLGTIVALVVDHVAGVSADSLVSDQGCVGFIQQANFAETTTPKGGLFRVPSLAGTDANTGTSRIKSLSIPDATTVAFPSHGYNATACAVVSFGFNNQAHAMIGFGSTGVIKYAGGSEVTAGTTADPGTGTFRVWFSGGNLQVRNASGSTRQCTIFYMG